MSSINNPGSKVQLASGQFTGDGGAARQITTGFKAAYVMLLNDTALLQRSADYLLDIACGRGADVKVVSVLHATDGFIVDNGENTNTAAVVYSYFAIEDV